MIINMSERNRIFQLPPNSTGRIDFRCLNILLLIPFGKIWTNTPIFWVPWTSIIIFQMWISWVFTKETYCPNYTKWKFLVSTKKMHFCKFINKNFQSVISFCSRLIEEITHNDTLELFVAFLKIALFFSKFPFFFS